MILARLMLVLAQSADPFATAFNEGYQLFQEQQWEQSATKLKQAAELRPKDFNSYYLLGGAYSRLGRTNDALLAWRAAEKINPKHARLLQLLTVEYGKGQYFQEALASAKQAFLLEPANLNVHLLAIKAAQDAGDIDEAFRIAKFAVERFPESARTNFEYGFHLQKVGRVEEATRYLTKAMQLDPSYEEPFFFYGDLLVKQDQSVEAVDYLRKAIQNRPDYVPARVTLARALMNLEKWDDALSVLEETVRAEPRHPQPHLLLSQIYFRRGEEDRARAEKELSLKLRRENPALLEAVQGRQFPSR